MKHKKSAIILVNWNGKKYLNNCLKALYNQTNLNFEVFFVDNGSTDNSVEFIKKKFVKIKIIKLEKNSGFAKGTNIGLQTALKNKDIKYFICLNNDTIVNKNWLEELIKTAESDEKIGAVSSKAYFDDNKTIQNAGLSYHKTIHTNKQGGISIGYGHTDKEMPELSKDLEIFAAGGVAPLFKRKVLIKLLETDHEIFDEDFFAYTEDFDLGFRIRKLGFKAKLSSKAKLIHLHSKTGGVASPFKTFYCERNTILTAIKNLSTINLILFPFRNILLKSKYLFIKTESSNKLKKYVGLKGMIKIFIKAHISAFLLTPKFLMKRWRLLKR